MMLNETKPCLLTSHTLASHLPGCENLVFRLFLLFFIHLQQSQIKTVENLKLQRYLSNEVLTRKSIWILVVFCLRKNRWGYKSSQTIFPKNEHFESFIIPTCIPTWGFAHLKGGSPKPLAIVGSFFLWSLVLYRKKLLVYMHKCAGELDMCVFSKADVYLSKINWTLTRYQHAYGI